MRVVLRWENVVKPLVAAWSRSLMPDVNDSLLLADTFLDEFRRRAVRHAGAIPGMLTDKMVDPPCHWCQLTSATWVGFTVEATGGMLNRSRLIRVWRLEPQPPPAARPSTPPS